MTRNYSIIFRALFKCPWQAWDIHHLLRIFFQCLIILLVKKCLLWTSPGAAMSHSHMSCYWTPGRNAPHLWLHFPSSGSNDIIPHQTKQIQCPQPLGIYLPSTYRWVLCKQRRRKANTKAGYGKGRRKPVVAGRSLSQAAYHLGSCAAVPLQGQDFIIPHLGLLLWQGMTLAWCREQHQIVTPGKRRDLGTTIGRLPQALQAGRKAEHRDMEQKVQRRGNRPGVMSSGSWAGSGDPDLGTPVPGSAGQCLHVEEQWYSTWHK